MKKIMLAAAALTALAFAALPAVAAATPHVSFEAGKSRHFTIKGTEGAGVPTFDKHLTLTSGGRNFTCESSGGEGEFDATGETGSVKFSFHGCRESIFNSTCTTEGDPSGTITTTTLPFHLKTTTGDKTPAVLITPAATGSFAHFKCLGGFVSVTVTGNGIVGEITSGYQKSKEFKVSFKENAGIQTPDTVDETPGTTYDLHASVNGGAAETAIEHATGIGTFDEGTPTLEKTP